MPLTDSFFRKGQVGRWREEMHEEMDAYAAEFTPEVWRTRIIEELGEEQAKTVLGDQ